MATTGDWITLSRVNNTFAFWFVDTNLWLVPIPTLVRSNVLGTLLNAFSAVFASLIVSSLTLTTKTSSGNSVVFPTPAKLLWAIPIADPILPTCLYLIVSPVTKKWFGILIVSAEILTILLSLPVKYCSNIGLLSWNNPNSLLIAFSVPWYSAKPVLIIPFVKSILSLESSTNAIAFIYAVTLTAIPALGLKYNVLVSPSILVPNVPKPVCDSTLPYSTI